MSVSLPNGATISIASTYGTAKTVTAVTNANPGVMTSTSHAISDASIIEITSGWSKLNGRIARTDNADANTFELEGIDTSSTTNYPAGSGTGSVRVISAWTQITQILEASSSGGEQQFATYSFLEDDTERQIPTNKSAQSMTLSIGDDQSLAHYAVLLAADQDRAARAIRISLPSGAVIYFNAYVTFNTTPSLTKNELMALQATFSLVSAPTRYSA